MSRDERKKGLIWFLRCLPKKIQTVKTTNEKNAAKISFDDQNCDESTFLDINDSCFNGDEALFRRYLQERKQRQDLSTVVNYEPTSMIETPRVHLKHTEHYTAPLMQHLDDNDLLAVMRPRHIFDEKAGLTKTSLDDSCLESRTLGFLESDAIRSSICFKHGNSNEAECFATGAPLSPGTSAYIGTVIVTLKLCKGKSLGITVANCVNGVFVSRVHQNGSAALSGQIEVGDLILMINDVNLKGLLVEEASKVLDAEVSKGGTIKILLAKHQALYQRSSVNYIQFCEQLQAAVPNTIGSQRQFGNSTVEQGKLNIKNNRPKEIGQKFLPSSRLSYPMLDSQKLPRGRKSVVIVETPSVCMIPPVSSGSSSSMQSSDSGYSDFLRASSALLETRTNQKVDQSSRPSIPGHEGNLLVRGGNQMHQFHGCELLQWISEKTNFTFDTAESFNYAQNLLLGGYIVNADFRRSILFDKNNFYTFGQNDK